MKWMTLIKIERRANLHTNELLLSRGDLGDKEKTRKFRPRIRFYAAMSGALDFMQATKLFRALLSLMERRRMKSVSTFL